GMLGLPCTTANMAPGGKIAGAGPQLRSSEFPIACSAPSECLVPDRADRGLCAVSLLLAPSEHAVVTAAANRAIPRVPRVRRDNFIMDLLFRLKSMIGVVGCTLDPAASAT